MHNNINIYTISHLKSSANNTSKLMTLQERQKNLQLSRNHLITTPSRLWQLAPVINNPLSELLCTCHCSKASKTSQENTYGRKRYINLSEKGQPVNQLILWWGERRRTLPDTGTGRKSPKIKLSGRPQLLTSWTPPCCFLSNSREVICHRLGTSKIFFFFTSQSKVYS